MWAVLSKVVIWFMCIVFRTRVAMAWSMLVEPLWACTGSGGQGHGRDLGADRDEAILQCRIVGLRIRLHTPQVIEVFPGHL
jgi:hypothetical protein